MLIAMATKGRPMTTATDTIDVSMADRRILAAALATLVRDLEREGRAGPVREHADRLMKRLTVLDPGIPCPSHVDFKQFEYLGLLTIVSVSDSWRLSWEWQPDEGVVDNRYALIAEVTLGDDDWRFEVARNLRGAGFLKLDPTDLAFCHLIEEQIRVEAGSSAQIIHEVIEIPLPFHFLPDEEVHNRIEKYLESVGAVEYPPAIHSTFVDIHSDTELAELEFYGVHTEVSGFEDELEHLKKGIEEHVLTISAGSAFAR
jgi:hypothetical protein